jgi:hypothetical protein
MTANYLDRVSVLVWVVLMGLAAQRFLSLPARVWTAILFGSPVTLTVTANAILGILLVGLVVSGTEAVVRAHPRSRGNPDEAPAERALPAPTWPAGPVRVAPGLGSMAGQYRALATGHWVFWSLPIALVIVALLLLPVAPTRLYWLLGLLLTGLALGLSLAGLYHTIDPFAPGYRRARLGMNALTYGVALLLFLVVYRTRVRSIISATEIMLLSGLLALELLRGSERPTFLVTLYAGITGLVLGQATWALNYWRLDSLSGGLILLLLFYNIVGLAQHALQGRISRRIVLEFGLITIAALALIWELTP